MFRRTLFASFFVVAILTFTPNAHSAQAGAPNGAAGTTALSRTGYRQTIRNMPILERPDRFGHFYGNTVRRLQRMGTGAR